MRTRIIEHYSHDYDLALVEGYSYSEQTDFIPRHRSVKKKIECHGWDNIEKLKKTIELSKPQKNINERIIQCSIEMVVKKQNGMLLGQEESIAYKALEKEHAQLTEESDRISQEKEQLDSQRNETMVETIKKIKLKPGQKVFTIAGTHHLLDKEHNYNVMYQLTGLKCAIIMPIVTQTNDLREVFAYIENGCRVVTA